MDYAVRRMYDMYISNQSLDPVGFTMAADVYGFAVAEFGLRISDWTLLTQSGNNYLFEEFRSF